MSSCGLVILAAGGSSRLGRPKQLIMLEGVSLLRRCALAAMDSGCRPIVAVLGAHADVLAAQLGGLSIDVVVNPHWKSGIGTSIRLGVSAVAAAQPAPEAVALLLCDQPLVDGGMIAALVNGRIESGKAICAAAYSGTLGTPAVFGAGLFGELMRLDDDQGGKTVLMRHWGDVHSLSFPEAAIDIDTEEDVGRLGKVGDAPRPSA